jgi:hypothetical protein
MTIIDSLAPSCCRAVRRRLRSVGGRIAKNGTGHREPIAHFVLGHVREPGQLAYSLPPFFAARRNSNCRVANFRSSWFTEIGRAHRSDSTIVAGRRRHQKCPER